MIKFREIFDGRKGESDLVSDKWSSYIEIYDKIFDIFSNKKISMVEIGVQNGGSLEVYNQYFPNSEVIIGIDRNEECRKLKFTTNKIKLIIDNAADKSIISKLNNYAQKYDIIIDDGSHTSEDIIKSFSILISAFAISKSSIVVKYSFTSSEVTGKFISIPNAHIDCIAPLGS